MFDSDDWNDLKTALIDMALLVALAIELAIVIAG
jgi:hypothetical protein